MVISVSSSPAVVLDDSMGRLEGTVAGAETPASMGVVNRSMEWLVCKDLCEPEDCPPPPPRPLLTLWWCGWCKCREDEELEAERDRCGVELGLFIHMRDRSLWEDCKSP